MRANQHGGGEHRDLRRRVSFQVAAFENQDRTAQRHQHISQGVGGVVEEIVRRWLVHAPPN